MADTRKITGYRESEQPVERMTAAADVALDMLSNSLGPDVRIIVVLNDTERKEVALGVRGYPRNATVVSDLKLAARAVKAHG